MRQVDGIPILGNSKAGQFISFHRAKQGEHFTAVKIKTAVAGCMTPVTSNNFIDPMLAAAISIAVTWNQPHAQFLEGFPIHAQVFEPELNDFLKGLPWEGCRHYVTHGLGDL